jgi:hypothetical protein
VEENPGTPVSAEYGRGDKRQCESFAPLLHPAKGSVSCRLSYNSPLINQLDTRGVTVSFQFEKTFNQENV